MEVILTDEIKTLGKKGQIVNVADGYARNFLIPNRKAVKATKASVAHENERLKVIQIKEAKQLDDAKQLAAKLENKSVVIKAKAGEQGKLFGTVTNKEIAEALKSQLDFEIDRRKINTEEDSIRTLGNHSVSIKLHSEVTAEFTVKVESE